MTREYVWSQIEPAVAILCACFVTYKPLLARLRTSVSSVFDSHERTSISGHWTDMRNHKRSTVRWPVAQDFGYAALQSPRCPVRRSGDPARPREIVIRIEGPDDGYFELSEVEQALDRRHRI